MRFCSSVRRARPGGKLIVVQDAFHGRTYGALSATPQESKQAPFAPLVPGFEVLPKDPATLSAAVDEDTAAVLLEPIQGETGIHPLSDELLLDVSKRPLLPLQLRDQGSNAVRVKRQALDHSGREPLHEDAAQELSRRGFARGVAQHLDRHAEGAEDLGEPLGSLA